jgi:hypothetical protein
MRRIAWIVMLAMGASLCLAGPAGAVDTKGPACANISSNNWIYTEVNVTVPTFVLELDTAKPTCRNATYTLSLTDANRNPITIAGGVFLDASTCPSIASGETGAGNVIAGDGVSTAVIFCWEYQGDPSTAPQTLYFVTNSAIKSHVADVGPDPNLPPADAALCTPDSCSSGGHQFG